MGIALEENEAGTLVLLEGTIDISSAAELKALLISALGTGKHLSISLAEVQYLDVTAVQLIWSAGQQAQRSGVGFSLPGIPAGPVAQSLADGGFPSFPT